MAINTKTESKKKLSPEKVNQLIRQGDQSMVGRQTGAGTITNILRPAARGMATQTTGTIRNKNADAGNSRAGKTLSPEFGSYIDSLLNIKNDKAQLQAIRNRNLSGIALDTARGGKEAAKTKTPEIRPVTTVGGTKADTRKANTEPAGKNGTGAKISVVEQILNQVNGKTENNGNMIAGPQDMTNRRNAVTDLAGNVSQPQKPQTENMPWKPEMGEGSRVNMPWKPEMGEGSRVNMESKPEPTPTPVVPADIRAAAKTGAAMPEYPAEEPQAAGQAESIRDMFAAGNRADYETIKAAGTAGKENAGDGTNVNAWKDIFSDYKENNANKEISENIRKAKNDIEANNKIYGQLKSQQEFYDWYTSEPDFHDMAEHKAWMDRGIKAGYYDDTGYSGLWSNGKIDTAIDKTEKELQYIRDNIPDDRAQQDRDVRQNALEKIRARYNEMAVKGFRDWDDPNGKYLQGKPLDYYESPDSKEYYNMLLYDSVFGNGAYENAADEKERQDTVDRLWQIMEISDGEKRRNKLLEMFYETAEGKELADLETHNRGELDNLNRTMNAMKGVKENRATAQKYQDQVAEGNYDTAYRPKETLHEDVLGNLSLAYTGKWNYSADEIYWVSNEGWEELRYATNTGAKDADLNKKVRSAAYMNEEQQATFNALYNAGEYDEAMAYYNSIVDGLQVQYELYREDVWEENAKIPVVGELIGLSSVTVKPWASLEALGGMIRYKLGDQSAGDWKNAAYDTTRWVDLTQGTRAKEWGNRLKQLTGWEGGQDVGEFLGGVTYSVLNNLYSMFIARGVGEAAAASMSADVGEKAMQLIMSSEAAASIYVQELQAGKDPTEALINAIGGGIIEAVTEEWSLGRYWHVDDVFSADGGLWQYLAKNFVIEGSEEVSSDILNTMLNRTVSYIYGHEDELMEKYQAYRDQGIDPDTASARVLNDYLLGLLQSFGAGGLSSIGLSGASVTKAGVRELRAGSRIAKPGKGSTMTRAGNTEMLLTIGETLGEDTESYKMSKKLQDKAAKGKKASVMELGKLAILEMQESGGQIREETRKAINGMVSEKLVEAGEQKTDADRVAEIVTIAATKGVEALNEEQRAELMKNEPAYQIYMELIGRDTGSEVSKEIAGAANKAADKNTATQQAAQFMIRTMLTKSKGNAVSKVQQNAIAAARKSGQQAAAKARETVDAFGLTTTGKTNEAIVIGMKDNREGDADVQVGQIVGFKDGKAVIRMEDGSEEAHALADIETPDENTATLIEYMKDRDGVMTDEAAGKIMAALEAKGKKAGGRFTEDAVDINFAARIGRRMPNYGSMDAETANAIYEQGKKDAAEVEASRVREYKTLKPGQATADFDGAARGSKEWNEKLAGLSKERRNQVEGVALFGKFLGIDVHFTEDNENRTWNAHTNPDGSVTFNIAATNARTNPDGTETETGLHHIYSAAGHDFTHILRQNSKEGWIQLRDYVFDVLEKQGVNIQAKAYEKMDQYNAYYKQINDKENAARKENGQEPVAARRMTIDDAVDEMIAESCANIMASDELANKLKNENRGLYNRIRDYVRELLGRIRNGIAGMNDSGNTNYYARRIVGQDLEGMAKRWLGAAEEAAGIFGARQEENVQGRAAEDARQKTAASINSPYVRESFREMDTDYEEAVENGDMETAQRIVVEAAKKAGYTIKGWHGSDADGRFTVFKRGQRGEMWFSSTEDTAYNKRKNMYETYLKMENPYEETDYVGVDTKFDPVAVTEKGRSGNHDGSIVHFRLDPEMVSRNLDIIKKAFPDMKADDKFGDNFRFLPDAETRKSLMKEGETLAEFMERGTKEDLYQWYTVYKPEQIKSADTVTYDDNGNKIPLSERFNPENEDIRYSLRETPDGTIEDQDGNAVAEILPGDVVTMYSIRTVDNTVNDELVKMLTQKGFSEKKIKKWIKDVQGIAAMIAADKTRLDYTPLGSGMLKNNQEYIKTLDASTLCAKRLLYQGIFNEIQHMLPNTPLMPEDLINLTNMMKKRGLMTPCSICYVESRRRLLGKYASEWLKEYDGAYKPRIEELTTTDGLQALKEGKQLADGKAVDAENSEARKQAYDDFQAAMNAKGSANPKVVQLRGEYNGEIMKMTDGQIGKVKEIGGLRVQSFSDFETVHMLDMMQAVLDMAARELTSQAYTKVPDFAWVFGDTGIKINLSLIGEGTGLDENGNLVFSSTEGMDIKDAMELRKAYSKNVGTILVGMNDAHVIAAMGDDRIDFIIPFHKSGWGKKEMALMIGMGTYKDFTRWQNEKKIDYVSKDGKIKTIPNKKSKISNFTPVGPKDGIGKGYWEFDHDGTWNAEKYLRLCAEDGRVPKFANFLINNGDGSFRLPTAAEARANRDYANIRKGYWKLLIDFKMYDNSGKGSPQTAVTGKFNMNAAKDVLGKYDGGADTLPTNHSLAQAFVDEYKEAHPRNSYSFRDTTDMDVNQWMMTVSENSLQTEAEKKLLRDYKGLRLKISLDMERQRGYQQKIDALKAKDELTKEEKYQLQGLQVRMENSKAAQAEHEKQLAQVTSGEGYARMMYQQSRVMDDFLEGRTQDEVNAAVETMERMAAAMEKEIEKTRAELEELAKSEPVRRTNAMMDGKSLDDAAGRILKENNSTMDRQELRNEIARIRFKAEAGMDIKQDMEDLAGKVLAATGKGTDPLLEQMRGETIVITKSQLKELAGKDGTLKEVRRRLAGTGIKVKLGDHSTLVDNLQDLQAEYGANMDFGGELDSLDNFLKWVEKRREDAGQNTGYTVDLQGAMADIALRVMDVKMNMASDPAAQKQMLELHRYIVEMAGKTEEMSAKVKSLQNRAAELLKSGKKAAAWSKSLKNDIGVTVDYYNRMAKLAEDTAKQRKQSEIIRQLKDKHTQEMLKANQEWRDLIERDRNARHQLEDNQNERKKMNTVVTRLMKLLSGPTGTKNIPEYLNGLARELVSAFVNSDTSDMRRKITFINREQLTEMRRRLQAWEMRDGGFDEADLAKAYDEETGDMILWMVNDDLRTIWDAIEEWNGEYRGKNKLDNLRQMGATLTRMQEAASEIYSIIKNAQQVALGDRKVAVADAAGKVRLGTEGKRKKEWTGAVGTKLAMLHKAVVSGNMTPEYFFRTIGNAGLTDLWNEYHRAENRNGLELAKAKARFAEIAQKHGYGTWDTNKRVTLQLEKGGTVNMTVGQLMSLWATWKREQTLGPEMSDHLRYGGFYVEQYDPREGILGQKGTEKKAHRVTEGDMAQVESLLTEEQRDFIDDVVGYMSSELSQLGNEASMKAYGIKLYKEKYYFPMQMWNGIKDRKSNDSGAAARQNQAFHPSFSKSRTHGANNALIIGDFMQTAADHAVGMINYATMGLANENFQKVLNHKVTEGYGDTETTRNIKAIMEEAYGKEAMQYLEDLKVQLNGGAVKIEKTFYDKLISLFRKNAVAGSLSVALQQPLSYIRAAMLIHPKYLTAALNPATWKGSYREMMEHSGVAVIKDMGRFDMNFGQSAREYVSPDELESKAKRIWGGVVDLSTMLPELMDRMTWTRMWSAVKAEQHAEHPEMDMKSDEFLDLCSERFNEVMRRTQVYDSVLVKSANMRSQSTPVKMLTSFMAEPTLTLNVLADSVRMAKEGEAGGKAMMAKAGATFLLSAVLQAAVKGLMGSGRTPDDKKTWLENFLYRFEYNLLNEADPLQLIPGFSDLMTVLKGGELKDDAYGTIQKMYKAGSGMVDMLTGKDNITYRNVEDSAGQLVQLFTGLPAKNIMRDARAMWNWAVEQPYADRPTSASVLKGQAKDLFYNADNMIGVFNKWLGEAGYSTDNKGYYQRIYDAKKAGNDELADEMTEYLTAGKGIKEDSIKVKVAGMAKSDDSMSAAETAEFLLNEGANAEDYVKKQLKEGEMTAEDARRFLAEDNRAKHEADPEKVKLKSADDIWWTVDRIEYGMETGEQPGGNAYYYRLKDAINSNKNDEIKAAVNSMIEHGKKKEDIKDWIGRKDTGFKTAYLEATGAEKVRIKDALIKAYKAVGVSEAEAIKIINGWK